MLLLDVFKLEHLGSYMRLEVGHSRIMRSPMRCPMPACAFGQLWETFAYLSSSHDKKKMNEYMKGSLKQNRLVMKNKN